MSTPTETIDRFASAPGITAPKEGPSTANEDPAHTSLTVAQAVAEYGPNYEGLPDELQAALLRLVQQFAAENRWARRQEVRAARQQRFFWRGIQYIYWSEKDQNWHLPTEQKIVDEQSSLDDMPRYQYVTNIYQAFGLSIIAPLTQAVPAVRFFPESAENPDDVATAKAASKVAEFIERTNKIQKLLIDTAYYAWTDGKIGAYVRHVTDGQRFGFEEQPEFAEAMALIAPAALVCPNCGSEWPVPGDQWSALRDPWKDQESAVRSQESEGKQGPAEDSEAPSSNTSTRPPEGWRAAALPAQEANDESISPVPCANCGEILTESNLRPEQLARVPQTTKTYRVPKGQEVITIVGALELKTPIPARDQSEYHYLMYDTEVHYSKLRAAYPHVSEEITGGTPSPGEDTFERIARVSTAQGTALRTQAGDSLYNLVTFGRTWIRPYAFYMEEDEEVRKRLLELFPDGCYVAFAGQTYCESRNESMDDHWVIMHALPGDGQNRPSIGESLISVQERFNDLTNLMMETYDYGIPVTWADNEMVDFDALEEQIAEPGSYQPITRRPGEPAAAGFFTPPQAVVAPDMIKHTMDLMGAIPQFVTGAFPSLFGGNMEDQKTASAYAMARDQAMGRLGLVWRRMRQFYADVVKVAVECFRANRTEDVEIPILGKGREFQSDWIRRAELKGNITVFPEGDESFPVQQSQQRAVFMQLMQMNDPWVAQTLSEPDNQAYGKQLIGLPDLRVPGADSRDKQYREIKEMLETRQPAPIDPLLDNHQVEFETLKDWANSDEGQASRRENPEGFLAIRTHGELHLHAMSPVAPGSPAVPPQAAVGATLGSPFVAPGFRTAPPLTPRAMSQPPGPAPEPT